MNETLFPCGMSAAKARLIGEAYTRGHGLRAVSAAAKVSETSVVRVLVLLGIPRRSKNARPLGNGRAGEPRPHPRLEEVLRAYDAGVTVRDIVSRFRLSSNSLAAAVRLSGRPLRSARYAGTRGVRLDPAVEKARRLEKMGSRGPEAARRYRTGESVAAIAAFLRCSLTTAQKNLRALGVVLRSPAEANRLTRKRRLATFRRRMAARRAA